MKFSIVAVAAAAGIASAQNARVVNNCKDTIYVQSVPPKGAAGPLTTVTAGKSFSEKFRTDAGSTIKIAKTRSLDNPLFFGYSFDAHNIFYEFSTQFGNPFAGNHNVLDAGEGCQAFDCKANDANCYSRPPSQPHKVYHCPPPANLTATICK